VVLDCTGRGRMWQRQGREGEALLGELNRASQVIGFVVFKYNDVMIQYVVREYNSASGWWMRCGC
jgi:hypothetical protein